MLQGINRCRRLGRGPVLLLLLPAATEAQQQLWQEHLRVPPVPAPLLEGRDEWLAISLSLTAPGSWKHQQTTRQDVKVCARALLTLALGALLPCSLSLTKDLSPDLCCELLQSQRALTRSVISGPEALFCNSKTGSYSHAKKMTDYIYF